MSVRDDLLAIDDDLLRTAALTEVTLVHMDFEDTPKWWWTGFGDLDVEGQTYQGLGDLISISGLTTTYQLSATPVTFEIAATPEMISLSRAAIDRVFGRDVNVWSQLMTTQTVDGVESWQLFGPRWSMFTGTMRQMPVALEGDDAASLQVIAEGLFTGRNAPPQGLLTDADQQGRYPGDKGLERIALYTNRETRWI